MSDILTPASTLPAGRRNEPETAKPTPPVSLFRKRLRKFKTLKRGYYSFLLIVALYLLSFVLPLFIGNTALVVHYKGETYFPLFSYIPGSTFGQADESGRPATSEANYRLLDSMLEASESGDWVLMPIYTWSPLESDYESVLDAPSSVHWLGTDDTGRDVLARMAYGFNTSMSFALVLVFFEFLLGTIIGSSMGYFGKWIDLLGQRIVEIWSNIPFLYAVIIISSILQPNFLLLIVVLSLFEWVGMSYLMRGEFLREKAKDYTAAAIALGAPSHQIIFKHILPNSLTPLIARFPFSIVIAINSLVALDYLGFGLPPPTPSWGQMISVGLTNTDSMWLVMAPIGAMFLTLLMITFVGESIREAFDPRVYSRLR